MDARLLIESKYMKSATFGVGDVPKEPVVTIDRIEPIEEEGDNGAERWWMLYFREPYAKPLKAIPTTVRCLIAMFGGDTDGWVGKRIQLFAMPGVWFGEAGTAVRIKAGDIKAAISVPIKMRGGKGKKKKQIYEIKPLPDARTGAPAAGAAKAAAPQALDPSTHVTFKNSPLYGKPIAELDHAAACTVAELVAAAAKSDKLTDEQRARVSVAGDAIAKRLKALEANPPAAAPVEKPVELSPQAQLEQLWANEETRGREVKRLIDALDDAGIVYQGERLGAERDYFASKRDELAAHIAAAAPPATPPPPAPKVETPPPPAPAASSSAPSSTAPEDQPVVFGPGGTKKMKVGDLDGVALTEHIGLGETKIGTIAADKRPAVRACIDAMIAVKEKRERALFGEPERQPGEDG